MIIAIDHIQLAMPKGGEAAARAFYEGVLGLVEIPKPPVLQSRGGCWFRSGPVEVHLGVEAEFAPARKAHPAFAVNDLDAAKTHLTQKGIAFRPDADTERFRRVFVDDPFGNRIELLEMFETPRAD